MTNSTKTGSVSAKGNLSARNITTGVDLQGPGSDDVVKAALAVMQQLQSGDVRAGGDITVSGDIVTGLRYLNPQTPTREAFVAEIKTLAQELAALAGQPDSPPELHGAAEALAEAAAEAEKEKPLAKRIANRLKETVEFIGDAGKALEAAGKAGPLIVQALGTATVLYQVASTLF